MANKRCCVPRCSSNIEGPRQVLHSFPNPFKDRQRFNTWIYAIGGDILGLEREYIFKHRRVCHIHFETKYCCRNNKISNEAVPTLQLPGPLSLPVFSNTPRTLFREIQNLLPSPEGENIHIYSNVTAPLEVKTFEEVWRTTRIIFKSKRKNIIISAIRENLVDFVK